MNDGIVIALAILILAIVYFILCGAVGKVASRKGRDPAGYFVLALLISPFFGWIIAEMVRPLPEALAAKGKLKKCPECAEFVQPDARKCRFCAFLFAAEFPPAAVAPPEQAIEEPREPGPAETIPSRPGASQVMMALICLGALALVAFATVDPWGWRQSPAPAASQIVSAAPAVTPAPASHAKKARIVEFQIEIFAGSCHSFWLEVDGDRGSYVAPEPYSPLKVSAQRAILLTPSSSCAFRVLRDGRSTSFDWAPGRGPVRIQR